MKNQKYIPIKFNCHDLQVVEKGNKQQFGFSQNKSQYALCIKKKITEAYEGFWLKPILVLSSDPRPEGRGNYLVQKNIECFFNSQENDFNPVLVFLEY